MQADRPARESEIRFVKCAHTRTDVHTHTSPCVNLPLVQSVVPVVILIPSEEPRQGSNELESWSRGPAECECVSH